MKKISKSRLFSVFVAICLLVGMLPIGVNGATFTDASSIKHPDAVQYLANAGIITGYPDGSFKPNGTLTRAEASAILTRLTGGSSAGKASFNDVPSNYWASGYIAYCASKGYVNGYGGGRFGPDDTLTGSAWSKMVLGALGYDAETSGMTGTNWTNAVADIAEEEDLYNGINNFNPDSAVSRDNACQIAYNGLYEPDGSVVTPPNPSDGSMISKLSYNFSNSRSAFGYDRGYKIPYERYAAMFGDSQFTRNMYEGAAPWGGSCYGLSSTTGMFYQPGNGVEVRSFNSSASVPNDLSVTDRNSDWNMTLQQFVETMHISQYSEQIQKYYNMDDIASVCQAVSRFQNGSSGPVIIAIFGPTSHGVGGHAIVGYAVEGSELLVYDCNFPNDATRSIALSTDSSGNYNGWYYSMNDEYDWGTAYSGSSISCIPYEDYYDLWQNRAEKTTSSMALLTSNGDITVTTPNGSPVAEIQNGEVKSNSSQTIPFKDISVSKDGETGGMSSAAVWIPAGAYNIERSAGDSTGASLEVSITHVDQSVDIVTSAGSMSVEVDDKTKTRTASLGAKEAGSSFNITIESTFGGEDEPAAIVLSGTVTDEDVTLGQDSGTFVYNGVDPSDIEFYYGGGVG